MTRKPYEVVEVLTHNNENLDHSKWYTGAITDFLLEGGDGFKDLMNVLYNHSDIHPFGSFRDQIAKQVAKRRSITSGNVDPKKPRM
jgi:hypothetical protein